ncbi:LysR family transcriptional regulator [Lacisediminimonas profundi]|uniref:LysR family transcriptional regulator n=1 Tax=Lacisediminimonas profundi TaxID=2603856 RepID=UPI00124B970A|nr:LysR family transcriptional regulator [Lacisediminimonas profundi]
MNIEYLQSFVAVVDAGSLAEAARRLDLTPPAMAARIKALEDQLGTSLLQRAGRAVRPTEAGLKILERARGLLRDVRDLHAIAQDTSRLGELRLGVFVSALTSVLPPVLKRLYEAYPAMSVFVAPGASVELCRRVSAGELDAAIVVEPQFAIPKTCEWQVLTEEPLVVVAHASMAGRDPHELLREEPFIRYDRSVVGGQLADRYLRDQDIHPRQRLEIDGLLAIAALIDHGLGVSLLPDWPAMWSGGMALARIPLPGRAPVRRIGLIRGLQSPHAALSEALLNEARSIFSEAPRPD